MVSLLLTACGSSHAAAPPTTGNPLDVLSATQQSLCRAAAVDYRWATSQIGQQDLLAVVWAELIDKLNHDLDAVYAPNWNGKTNTGIDTPEAELKNALANHVPRDSDTTPSVDRVGIDLATAKDELLSDCPTPLPTSAAYDEMVDAAVTNGNVGSQ